MPSQAKLVFSKALAQLAQPGTLGGGVAPNLGHRVTFAMFLRSIGKFEVSAAKKPRHTFEQDSFHSALVRLIIFYYVYLYTRSIKWYLNLGNEKFRYQWFKKCSSGKKVLEVFFPYVVSLSLSFSRPLQPTHHTRYFISADGWWSWPSGPWVRTWQVLLEHPAVLHKHPSKCACGHFQWMSSAGYPGTFSNEIFILPTGET